MNMLVFDALVQRFATAARASAGTVLDFTVGSILRALAEANAAAGLWLQWLLLIVLRQTRLATSIGAEVDSFVGDFGLARLPAVASIGSVTFSRYTATLAAFIPVGTSIKTLDGTQSFAVIADTTNTAYSATLGGYTIPAATASLTVAAQAVTAGAASNVQTGTVTVLASAVAGVDTVTNALAFSGGYDAESDAALRVRFQLYIQSLSKGTAAAIGYAVLSVQQGLSYTLLTAQDTQGNPSPGNFVVLLDDGSGVPSTTLLNTVYAAVDAVRAIGATFSVIAPTVTTVTVIMTVSAAAGYVKAAVQAAISTAVTQYINTLPVGSPLYYTALARVAMDASAGVGSIVGLTVNGGQADVVATSVQVLKAGSVSVN